MERYYGKERVLAREKKISIGIDVNKESCRSRPSLKGRSYFMGGCLGTIQRGESYLIGLSIVRYG